MFGAVKDVLTKEIEVKDIKNLLEMEIELKKVKEMLETEIKLKEFLLQEINISDLIPDHKKKTELSSGSVDQEVSNSSLNANNDAINKAEKKVVAPVATVTPKLLLPSYDFGLIDKLHQDHEELVFIYRELMTNAKAQKYSMVADHLENFTSRITEHYAMADKALYNYLKVYVQQKYPKRVKAFNELSLEMKNVSLSIFFSVSQSSNIPVNDKSHEGFMAEFNQLGSLLRTRINREKQVLFKMYQESHEAKEISGSL